MLLVLFALYKMGGSRTKEEVLRHIRANGWMASTPQDHENYEGKNESKSDTLLCFARLDDVKKGLMFHHDESDCWDITRMGQDFLENQKHLFGSEKQDVRHCYMWTPKFKTIFDTDYVPSEKDHTASRFVNEYLGLSD